MFATCYTLSILKWSIEKLLNTLESYFLCIKREQNVPSPLGRWLRAAAGCGRFWSLVFLLENIWYTSRQPGQAAVFLLCESCRRFPQYMLQSPQMLGCILIWLLYESLAGRLSSQTSPPVTAWENTVDLHISTTVLIFTKFNAEAKSLKLNVCKHFHTVF